MDSANTPYRSYRAQLRGRTLQHRTGSFTLADFQQEAVDKVQAAWGKGASGALLEHATGCGKTECAIALILREPPTARILFLVHRRTLVHQAAERIALRAPELAGDVGMVMGGHAEDDRRILVSTLQSLSPRRQQRLHQITTQHGPYDLVVCDEVHHLGARSFARVVHFLHEAQPHVRFLGLSATIERADGRPLPPMLGRVVDRRSVRWAVDHGFLVPPVGIRVQTNVDLSRVQTRRGDYENESLAQAIDTPARNHVVVQAYRRHARGRRCLVFCANVAHARHVCEAFGDARIPAEVIVAQTNDADRRAIIQRFITGRTKVIVNVAVLTEGFDCPVVEALIMARPTRSRVLYVQTVGRALRLSPGKSHAIIVDVTDSETPFTLEDMMDGPAYRAYDRAQVTDPRRRPQVKPDPEAPPVEEVVLQSRDEVHHLLSRTEWAWYSVGATSSLVIGENEYAVLAAPLSDPATARLAAAQEGDPERQAAAAWRLKHRDRYVLYHVAGATVTPRDWDTNYTLLLSVAGNWVADHLHEALTRRDRSWRTKPATPKQVAALMTRGLLPHDHWLVQVEREVGRSLSRGLASEVLGHRYALQAISRAGFDPYADGKPPTRYLNERWRCLLRDRGTAQPRMPLGV